MPSSSARPSPVSKPSAEVASGRSARQIWSLLDLIDAQTAEHWNRVSDVVPPALLIEKAREYAREIASYSPTALNFLRHSFNADTEHIAGVSNIAFDGLDMFVHSDEGLEGAKAFADKRKPDFSRDCHGEMWARVTVRSDPAADRGYGL
jgi:1,4-dihydroxy-2-naphthoyl-CoA synthase